MVESYLIQRLKKPFKSDTKKDNQNILSFGGGLINGGLRPEAMKLLNDIFRFDYMGSSEFEWGAVPEAIQKIAQYAIDKKLIATKNIIKYKYKDWRRDITLEGSRIVYIICKKEELNDIIVRIEKFAINSYNNTKEMVMLNEVLTGESEFYEDLVGWLELDNGYFFFSDKEMFDKTCQLFGLKQEAK